jgi:hypothetical protein
MKTDGTSRTLSATEQEAFDRARMSRDLEKMCYVLASPEIRKIIDDMETLRAERLAAQDYVGFLTLFDGHKRLNPFVRDVVPRVRGGKYWELLSFVWDTSEIISPDGKIWAELFTRDEPEREQFMSEDDRSVFLKLPATLKVFRGFWHAGGELGFSWTLKKSKAKWFASHACQARRGLLTRFSGSAPTIAVGHVNKSDVFGYLNGRKEKEIIVSKPELVRDVQVTAL